MMSEMEVIGVIDDYFLVILIFVDVMIGVVDLVEEVIGGVEKWVDGF